MPFWMFQNLILYCTLYICINEMKYDMSLYLLDLGLITIQGLLLHIDPLPSLGSGSEGRRRRSRRRYSALQTWKHSLPFFSQMFFLPGMVNEINV